MRAHIATLVLAAGLLGVRAAHACESDSECKGERVCESGRCVVPSESAPKKKPKPIPKKVEPEEASEEETPPPPPPRKPPGERHPWAYEREPLTGWSFTTRLAGIYGQSLRADDRQYYGLGATLAGGITNDGGAYLGAQYSPHFGGRLAVDEYLYGGERLTGEVKYDSYNAGLDLGFDTSTSSSSALVVRATAGVGWATYYAKGYFNPTSVTPRTELDNAEAFLYLDFHTVFAWKVSESWHLDLDVRWLYVPAAGGDMLRAGTVAYGLGLGRRF